MKKFNQEIKVTVQVDTIANNLLASFDKSFPHAEMLTETIIAIGIEKDTISLIYNNLCGFTNDIDFKIGQEVVCSDKIYGYVPKTTKELGVPVTYDQEYVVIGNCVITDINTIKDSKVQIKYSALNRRGESEQLEKWVSHTTLSLVEIAE